MGLLETWRETAYSQEADKKQLENLWAAYFKEEKGVYEQLLENPDEAVTKEQKDEEKQ